MFSLPSCIEEMCGGCRMCRAEGRQLEVLEKQGDKEDSVVLLYLKLLFVGKTVTRSKYIQPTIHKEKIYS